MAGDDMRGLAARWGLHRTTVAGHLRRAGVELRRQGIALDRINETIRLTSEGWPLQRPAERFSRDDETVRQALKRAGVHCGVRGSVRSKSSTGNLSRHGPLTALQRLDCPLQHPARRAMRSYPHRITRLLSHESSHYSVAVTVSKSPSGWP
jgi:hypothetical protein